MASLKIKWINMFLPVGKIKDRCFGPKLPLKAGAFFYDCHFTEKEIKAQRGWGFAQSHKVSEPERGSSGKTLAWHQDPSPCPEAAVAGCGKVSPGGHR